MFLAQVMFVGQNASYPLKPSNEKKRESAERLVTDTIFNMGNKFSVIKVPRQCSLALIKLEARSDNNFRIQYVP
jgi:hypothetical protein